MCHTANASPNDAYATNSSKCSQTRANRSFSNFSYYFQCVNTCAYAIRGDVIALTVDQLSEHYGRVDNPFVMTVPSGQNLHETETVADAH